MGWRKGIIFTLGFESLGVEVEDCGVTSADQLLLTFFPSREDKDKLMCCLFFSLLILWIKEKV